VPDFHHPELSEGDVVASSARVAKAMPKALRRELAPFAAEIATPLATEASCWRCRRPARVWACWPAGDLAASLAALTAATGQPLTPAGALAVPAALALIDFALSEEHEQLVAGARRGLMIGAPIAVSEEVAALHREALVIDLHNDVLTKISHASFDFATRHGSAAFWNPFRLDLDLPKIRAAGIDALGCAMFAGFRLDAGRRFWRQLDQANAG
jgi:hypothetical protein